MSGPEMLRVSLLTCQVCVPKHFTDAQVEEFVNQKSPTGISSPWRICHKGHEFLDGADERVQCEDHSRTDCVHLRMSC